MHQKNHPAVTREKNKFSGQLFSITHENLKNQAKLCCDLPKYLEEVKNTLQQLNDQIFGSAEQVVTPLTGDGPPLVSLGAASNVRF